MTKRTNQPISITRNKNNGFTMKYQRHLPTYAQYTYLNVNIVKKLDNLLSGIISPKQIQEELDRCVVAVVIFITLVEVT